MQTHFFVFEMLAYICTSCSVHRETHGYPKGVSKYRLPFLLISIRVGQPRKIMLLFIFSLSQLFHAKRQPHVMSWKMPLISPSHIADRKKDIAYLGGFQLYIRSLRS